MGEDIDGQDIVALDNAVAQLGHDFYLLLRKWPVAKFVARILDLDADGTGVYILLALPVRFPGMPGAHIFIHKARHTAIFLDKVMRADLMLGLAALQQPYCLESGF